MIVRLFNFSKKARSTKRPTIPADTDPTNLYEGITVDPMDILNPVLKFDLGAPSNAPTFNYAYIKELGQRLYFITKWVFDNGFWIASMECDELGSWKTQIGSTTQFVTRSSYEYDEYLVDGISKRSSNNTYTKINILNSQSDIDGWEWVRYNAMSKNSYQYIILVNTENVIFTEAPGVQETYRRVLPLIVTGQNIYDMMVEIVTTVGSEYIQNEIVGLYYCPLLPIGVTPLDYGKISSIVLNPIAEQPGGIGVNFTDKYPLVIERLMVDPSAEVSVTLPSRPTGQTEAWKYCYGRDLYLNGLPFGRIKLDSAAIGTHNDIIPNKIELKFNIDWYTGNTQIYYRAYKNLSGSLYSYLCNVNLYAAVPFSISGIGNVQAKNIAQAQALINTTFGLGATVISTFTGNPLGIVAGLGGMASGILSSASSVANANKSEITQFVANSTTRTGTLGVYLEVFDYEYKDLPIADVGRPLCQYKTINAIPGFIQCESPIFSIRSNMLPVETSSILQSMSNGFFYE